MNKIPIVKISSALKQLRSGSIKIARFVQSDVSLQNHSGSVFITEGYVKLNNKNQLEMFNAYQAQENGLVPFQNLTGIIS